MTDWAVWGQLFFDGAWNVLEADVLTDPGYALERGVGDDLDLKAATCTWRLRDDTDRYRPSNAASPLYGQTGPYMKGAFATGGVVLFTGEAQAMNPGQTDYVHATAGVIDAGHRWVDVKLGGTLARVGRWRDVIGAPLVTQITGYGSTLRGFYPLDDGRDAVKPRNMLAGGRPGNASGVSFTSADGPAGAGDVVQMNSGGRLTGGFNAMSTTAGFQIGFAVKIVNASATALPVFSFNTTGGYVWTLSVSTTTYNLDVAKPDGTSALGSAYSTGDPVGDWTFFRLKVTQSGGNVIPELAWYGEAAAVFWGITDSFAGSIGAPTNWTIVGNATTTDAGYASVFALAGVTDDLTSGDFTDAFNAYVSEHAADRFTRLCRSRNLSYVLRGSAAKSIRMGPQPFKTVNDQFKELRQTEGGLIFDRGDNIGVVMCTRDYLYSQAAAPALALTYPDQVSGLAEVSDARDVYNQVTADNAGGGAFTVAEPTGKLGTADPPTGAGLVDLKLDTNVFDEGQLEDTATWWLRYFTNEGPRFEALVIDLDLNGSLLSGVNALEPGMFITVTGRTPDPLLLMITRMYRSGHRSRNVATLEVVDGRVFRVGVYDEAASRYDSASTTVASTITAAATTLPVTTTNVRDVWSTTAVPYALTVLGERVTCTAASAPAGSGPYTQNLTITRGVNGFSKSLTAGARVGLADPVRRG